MSHPAASYVLPAEWLPHAATWIGWPHYEPDWRGKLPVLPRVFAEMVRSLALGERVRILIESADHQRRAEAALRRARADLAAVDWFRIPTTRNWVRDSGPIFLRQAQPGQALVIADFRFNAWARYPNWRRDDAVARRVASLTGRRPVEPVHRGRRVVLEGGAVDVNGCGTLIATEECHLDPVLQVRNPGFSRRDLETVFRRYLGAHHTVWLGRGIAGDDTHGHVDDLCRFVNATTVLLAQERNPADENYTALAENRERLESARLEDGGRLQVIPLPMPVPLRAGLLRLPASYANFYIANASVLVPTFRCPADSKALGILADCFPGRRIVGINARDLIWGLGAIHCLTQQEPAV